MTKIIYLFADIISRPIAFAVLTFAALLGSAVAIATSATIDAATVLNITLSVLTMVIGQAVLVSGRRDGLAFHLKLDRIIEALPTGNEAIGSEHEPETNIQTAIEAVESRVVGKQS
jgi:low affinity Fe/Cu permease